MGQQQKRFRTRGPRTFTGYDRHVDPYEADHLDYCISDTEYEEFKMYMRFKDYMKFKKLIGHIVPNLEFDLFSKSCHSHKDTLRTELYRLFSMADENLWYKELTGVNLESYNKLDIINRERFHDLCLTSFFHSAYFITIREAYGA